VTLYIGPTIATAHSARVTKNGMYIVQHYTSIRPLVNAGRPDSIPVPRSKLYRSCFTIVSRYADVVGERLQQPGIRQPYLQIKDINSLKGRSDTRCFKLETAEQCILGKWQDNGANHAPNCRIKVNKTPNKNKKRLTSSIIQSHI
jgi:hypothetical protein